MLPLREYLTQRRSEVQAQIKALRAELGELDRAWGALGRDEGPATIKERGSSGSGRKTLKELAVEALAEHPEGLEASAITSWIKAKYGFDVQRESLSPQLSRLGQDGVLTREGYRWRLDANPAKESANLADDDAPPPQGGGEIDDLI